MDEILRQLPAGAPVLDLGCGPGSFPAAAYPLRVIRSDIDAAVRPRPENFVASDAAALPFPEGLFSAVILNHSLGHIRDARAVFKEIGRVLAPAGCLYIAIPDASTFSDRLYRWLAKGGGHVNPISDPAALVRAVQELTGLDHIATRLLFTSFCFLNRKHVAGRRLLESRRLLRYGSFGTDLELPLKWATLILRWLDRWTGARLSAYGWAFYFGPFFEIETAPSSNVCIRCGSGHAAAWLLAGSRVTRPRVGIRWFACPTCGARNFFTPD